MEQFTRKSKIHIFPLICYLDYLERSCRVLEKSYHHSFMIELVGTQRVVPKEIRFEELNSSFIQELFSFHQSTRVHLLLDKRVKLTLMASS